MRSTVKALKRLDFFISEFKNQNCPIVVSDSNLSEFIHRSEDSELSVDQRLIALAVGLQHEDFQDGWRGFSRIYETAKEYAPLNTGITVVWLVSAIEFWLVEKTTLELQERVNVANDAEILLKELGQSASYMQGLLYYRHPLRLESEQHFLNKALQSFQIAIDISMELEETIMPRLYTGYCLFELGKFEEALHVFDSLDTALLEEMNCGEHLRMLTERIRLCKTKIL